MYIFVKNKKQKQNNKTNKKTHKWYLDKCCKFVLRPDQAEAEPTVAEVLELGMA